MRLEKILLPQNFDLADHVIIVDLKIELKQSSRFLNEKYFNKLLKISLSIIKVWWTYFPDPQFSCATVFLFEVSAKYLCRQKKSIFETTRQGLFLSTHLPLSNTKDFTILTLARNTKTIFCKLIRQLSRAQISSFTINLNNVIKYCTYSRFYSLVFGKNRQGNA